MRSSNEIKKEIESRIGFFPPFFAPALEAPQILENLWQQTLSAYMENPLPPLFKEKFAAIVARSCSVPYCLVCHSCTLRPLGMKAGDVLDLLEKWQAPSESELHKYLNLLAQHSCKGGNWPEAGSDIEDAILHISVQIFFGDDETESYSKELRRAIGDTNYDFLILYIGYNKTCLTWAEAHANELSFEADQRAREHLGPLLAEEPRLGEFFRNYKEKFSNAAKSKLEKQLSAESETKYKKLIQLSPAGIFQADATGKFVFVSEGWQRVAGLSLEEAINAGWENAVHPDDKEKISKEWMLSDTGKRAFKCDYRLRKPNGEITWVSAECEQLRNNSGEITGYLGALQDITNLKNSEEELVLARSELERRVDERTADLRSLTESIPQLVWKIAPDGESLYMSPNWTELTGVPSDQAEWEDIIHPEDVPASKSAWLKCLETGSIYETEYRIKIKNGTYRWFLARGVPQLDLNGKVKQWFGTCTDIDDQRRAADLLARSVRGQLAELDSYRVLADAIPQLAWIAQADGYIFWYNRRWYDFTGTEPKDMEGWGWISVHDPEILPQVLERWQGSIQSGDPFEMEFPLRGADGQFRWFLTRVTPVRDAENKIVNWFGTNTDINEQKIALQSNKRIAAIVESSNDAIIGKDLTGTITSWNPAAEKIFGYRREEMIGKSILNLFPEDRISEEASILDKLQRGLQISHFETERIRKDGIKISVLLSMSPIYDDKGKVVGIAKTARDITQEKEAQVTLVERTKSLVDLQSRFEKVSHASNLGVWYCNLPFDKLIWSDKVKEHFWMDVSREVTIEDFYSYLHDDDRERVRQAIALSIEEHKSYDVEYRTVLPGSSDHYKWIRAIGWTDYDSLGKPIQFDGITLDITEEKKTREELRKSQEALKNSLLQKNEYLENEVRDRTIAIAKEKQLSEELSFRLNFAADASTIGIWEWNILENSLIWNAQMYQLYGLKSSDGHEPYASWYNGLHPEDRDKAVAEIQDAVAKKTKFDAEFRIMLPTGEVRRIHAQAASLLNEKGEAVRMIGVNTDVTLERLNEAELSRAREEAISASKMKSDFLANMSHEIRTPINGVIGMMGLLSDTRLLPEQREYADAAKSSADALLTVINDILDFSKVEAGKLEFEDIDFDLLHLFKDVAKTFSFPARSKGISLSIDIDPKTPRYVGGDPGRIRQVLNNLVSNALKFTEKGGVSIEVKPERIENQESRLRIEIKDSGIGMPEKARSRMFQAFSQADASTTRRFGGTGLGLSISKHLVEKMQGTIGVESTEGQGSTFWFTLSLRSALAPVRGSAGRVGNFKDLSERHFRVLIAEDNAVNQKIAVRVLEKMGLSADAVANGQEVLDAHRSIPYDLILMDCQMPELDGYETTRKIRASKSLPRTDIPIIAMTANALSGDKERCISAGMNDYVSKPVKNDDLFAVLSRWLLAENKSPVVIDQTKATADILDKGVIDELLSLDENGDRGLMKELVGMWLVRTPVVMELIKNAMVSGDLKNIAAESHQLKSSSGNLGAMRISKLSGQIEAAALATGVSELRILIPQLEAAVQEAVPELQALSNIPHSSVA